MKKSACRSERRKHDHDVTLDRRKHDDDFAERMGGGIRTWSPKEPRQATIKQRVNRDDS
jgi:hypothetical protein